MRLAVDMEESDSRPFPPPAVYPKLLAKRLLLIAIGFLAAAVSEPVTVT